MPAERGTLRGRAEGPLAHRSRNASLQQTTEMQAASAPEAPDETQPPPEQADGKGAALHLARSVAPGGLGLRLTLAQIGILAACLLLLTGLLLPLLPHPLPVHVLWLLASGALALLILGAALSLLATAVILRPLQTVLTVGQALARGELEQRGALPVGEDEASRLGASLKILAEQVERSQRLQRENELRVQRLISSASHELRTPLTSIRGLSEVLLRGPIDNPEVLTRALRLIKGESERMTRLINDMLMLVRLDEGRPLHYREIDLVELAIECVEQARVAAGEQGPRIHLELATQERLVIKGDADRLKQALFALLDNAVKYGCPGQSGSVSVRLDCQGSTSLIQVIDHGPGIAPEDLPHIFERFYRGRHLPPSLPDGTTIPGAGLGLALARAVARAHQGEVSVRSEVEQGSTFTLALPSPVGTRPLSATAE
jgi:signal transduction histidine kinase